MRRFGLLVLSTLLLSAAYEPFGLPFLAWTGLVPWIMALRGLTPSRAFCWGWLGGLLFYAANIWWLWVASIPGMIALMVYLALYWGLTGLALHVAGLIPASAPSTAGRPGYRSRALGVAATVMATAAFWAGIEWCRATFIDPCGFPWMFVGHSQSTFPVMCQIADLTGVFGVSFWVVLINALVVAMIHHRAEINVALPAAVVLVGVLAATFAYGLYRTSGHVLEPGPRVMLVQENHRHLRGGARTVSRDDTIDFYLDATRYALHENPADLVVWAEAAMPPLNPEAREVLADSQAGMHIGQTHRRIAELASDSKVSVVVGANWVGGWTRQGTVHEATDIRNSAYLYLPDGRQSPSRYDKTALVLFSERVPFRSIPLLHRIMLWFAPPVARQTLVPGAREEPTVFAVSKFRSAVEGMDHATALEPVAETTEFRFVTPICLENIYPRYVSHLVVDRDGFRKRADFIVNISNDGWFAPFERHQHLQNVVFRCIENRVPQARVCNTGISAFVDSSGCVARTLPAGESGTVTHQLMIDRRVTFYAWYGDLFGQACLLATAGILLLAFVRWFGDRWSPKPGSRRAG